jgi:DNA repair exonuclease SbcCD ATPase subunit
MEQWSSNLLGNEVVDPPPLHDSHGQAIADSLRGTAAAHSGAAFSDAETDGKGGSSTNKELLRVESALRRRESEVANLERRLKQSKENLRVTEKENEAREQALSALVSSLEERLARTDQRANTSSGRGNSVEDEELDWRALLEQLREAAHQLSRGSASGCSDEDVKAILHKVLKDAAASKYKVAALKEEVAALKEEAAKLKRELALRDTELEQLKEQLKRQLAGNSHCINGREAEPNQRSLDASSYYSPEEEAPEEEATADKKKGGKTLEESLANPETEAETPERRKLVYGGGTPERGEVVSSSSPERRELESRLEELTQKMTAQTRQHVQTLAEQARRIAELEDLLAARGGGSRSGGAGGSRSGGEGEGEGASARCVSEQGEGGGGVDNGRRVGEAVRAMGKVVAALERSLAVSIPVYSDI